MSTTNYDTNNLIRGFYYRHLEAHRSEFLHKAIMVRLCELAKVPPTPDYPVFTFLATYHRLLLTQQIRELRTRLSK